MQSTLSAWMHDRVEFKRALDLYKSTDFAANSPPTSDALRLCFVSAAIPFVAFG